MKTPNSVDSWALEDKAFLWLVIAISLAFAWILWPFYGAIFWGTVLAIVFRPLHRRVLWKLRQRPNLAALTTVTVILLIVILPSTLITAMLLQEGFAVYSRIQSGELSFTRYSQQVFAALPTWITDILDRFGLTSLGEVQQRISAGLTKGIQFFAGQALNFGQNTLEFVLSFFIMLYLLFFLLRDGDALARRMRAAIPLHADQQRNLIGKFTAVIRATVKGTIVVAVVQGLLGGFIFWLLGIRSPVLWGTVMGFLSLLPAVGTALVWLPVAIYFLVGGQIWQGLLLTAYGVLVIGLVDNILRPILVGKETKIPDYVVLISTLGGMAIFGFNGFVIGPMIAALFMAVWDIVATTRAQSAAEDAPGPAGPG